MGKNKTYFYVVLGIVLFLMGFLMSSMINSAYAGEYYGAPAGGFVTDVEAPALPEAPDTEAADIGTAITNEGYTASAFTDQDTVPYPVAVQYLQDEARSQLALVNEHRAANGKSALTWDSGLEESAIQRAAEISVSFSHTRPNATSPFTAFDSYGSLGENIAAGTYYDAQNCFNGWKASPGHNANMLDGDFKSVGIACAYVPDGTKGLRYYWVQCFSSADGDDTYYSVTSEPTWRIVPILGSCVTSCYLDGEQPVYVGRGGYSSLPPVYMAYGGTITVDDGNYGPETSRDLTCEFTFPARFLNWSTNDGTIAALTGDDQPIVVGVQRGTTYLTGRFPQAPNMNLYVDVAVTPVGRISADTAAGTAALIADYGFESADVAIVARADDFADAMSATGLAGTLDAPIILTDRTALSEETEWALTRLGVKTVYIIGGTGAISEQVDQDIKALGIEVMPRIWGEYSWDTSVACATRIQTLGGNETGEVIVAMSSNFQDALSISSFAYRYHVPILLEDQSRGAVGALTGPAQQFIANKTTGTIFVPGGPGAVNADTVEGVFTGRTVTRIYGEDGFDTSNQIAHYMIGTKRLIPNAVGVTCGAQAPKGVDALAGSALLGKIGGPILLVNGNPDLGAEELQTIVGADSRGTQGFLTVHKNEIDRVFVLGGNYVVPNSAFRTINGVFM